MHVDRFVPMFAQVTVQYGSCGALLTLTQMCNNAVDMPVYLNVVNAGTGLPYQFGTRV